MSDDSGKTVEELAKEADHENMRAPLFSDAKSKAKAEEASGVMVGAIGDERGGVTEPAPAEQRPHPRINSDSVSSPGAAR